MLIEIDHINLVVADLDSCKNFFLEIGFEEIASGYLSGAWIDQVVGLNDVKADYVALRIPNAATKIELIKYYSPEREKTLTICKANDYGFRHIAFKVKDIEKLVENFKKQKVKLFSEIKIYPANGKKLCYFYGPENIILELCEYQS